MDSVRGVSIPISNCKLEDSNSTHIGGDGSITNSASHTKEYIEGTIERLGFTPDLYYLHRIDPSEWNYYLLVYNLT
jgi:aryl-alcohol dehydrogenase-like predicted oxidoreductase